MPNANCALFPARFSERKVCVGLLLIAAGLILVGLGLRSPWPPDEPRFALVAKEMVESGQWLFPTRGGEYYPDKPPVFMWSIALFYWLTGSIKVAALLPNALCSLVTLGLTYGLARQLFSRQVAQLSAVLLLVTPQFLIQAKFAQIDAMVACWIMVGVYGLMQHFFLGPNRWWYHIAWAMMGLGVITKGVGFLPVLLLIPVFYLMRTGRITARWKGWDWLGPVTMLATIGLWFVPMYLTVELSHDPLLKQYRDNILFKQTATRYADAWHHLEPWYYYLTSVIPLFWLPSIAVVALHPRQWLKLVKQQAPLLALAGWVIAVVVFFSLSPGKRGVYLLPATPVMAIMAAMVLEQVGISRRVNGLLHAVTGFIGAGLVVIGGLALSHHPALVDKIRDYQAAPTLLDELGLVLLLMGAGVVLSQWLYRRRQLWTHLTLCAGIICVIFGAIATPLMQPIRTPDNVLDRAFNQSPPETELAIIDLKSQYLLYAKRPLTHFGYHTPIERQQARAWRWVKEKATRRVLVPERHDLPCFKHSDADFVGVAHRKKWYVLSLKQAMPECPVDTADYQSFTHQPRQR